MDEIQIIDALRSGDLERQATALDEAARAVKTLVSSLFACSQSPRLFIQLRRRSSNSVRWSIPCWKTY